MCMDICGNKLLTYLLWGECRLVYAHREGGLLLVPRVYWRCPHEQWVKSQHWP